jgi:hypothetical protein
MNEQPEFDFDKELTPLPKEEIDKIEDWLRDLEERFPLKTLRSITDINDDYNRDIRGVAIRVYNELHLYIEDVFTKYDIPKEFKHSIVSRMEAFASATGGIDSVSGKVIHNVNEQR